MATIQPTILPSPGQIAAAAHAAAEGYSITGILQAALNAKSAYAPGLYVTSNTVDKQTGEVDDSAVEFDLDREGNWRILHPSYQDRTPAAQAEQVQRWIRGNGITRIKRVAAG